MFSGIIENLAEVIGLEQQGSNITFQLRSTLAPELKIDQSLAHNGVCLTVESLHGDSYKVTVIAETLSKTNLGKLKPGDRVNLERSMTPQSRIDGHIVQGHVDTTATCIEKKDMQGSWLFSFSYPAERRHLLVEKGSITVNGVSLTAFNCLEDHFSVAIIPYTFTHTTFGELKEGDKVNIEFDILGKYMERYLQSYALLLKP